MRRNILISQEQDEALRDLATALDVSGQRGERRSAIIQHIADIAISAPLELAWLLEVANQVAIGGDLDELLEMTPLPELSE